MFAVEVLVQNVLIQPKRGGVQHDRAPRQLRNFLENDRGAGGLHGRGAPGERGVAGHQNAGDGQRVQTLEAAHDGVAGVLFVRVAHLFVR